MAGGGDGGFLLVYATQTGQAQAIAEEIAEKAPQHGLTAHVYCMSLTEKKVLRNFSSVVVISQYILLHRNVGLCIILCVSVCQLA